MKKKLWMLGVAIAALTSCTQNEVLDIPEGKAIGFKTFVGKETRTQEQVTSNNISNFWVFGYKTQDDSFTESAGEPNYSAVFNNINVYTSSGTGGNLTTWTYDNQQYWSANSLYRFAAYANGAKTEASGNISTGVSYKPIGDYLEFTDYVAGEYDLVASIPGDRVTHNVVNNEAVVAFNFNHLLSRIEFVFEEQANVFIKVLNLRIEGAVKKGTAQYFFNSENITEAYTYKTEFGKQGVKWNLGTETGYTYEPVLTPSLSANAGDVMYVIPQANTALTAKFTIVTYQDAGYQNEINSREVEVPLNTTNIPIDTPENESSLMNDIHKGKWNPGFVYRYKVVFTADKFNEFPIRFRVNSVIVWDSNITTNNEANTMVPNVNGDVTPPASGDGGDDTDGDESGQGGDSQ